MKTNSLASQLCEKIRGSRYERHVDRAEDSFSSNSQMLESGMKNAETPNTRHRYREVRLTLFPESYQPLTVCDEEQERAQEEKKKRKKEKYKKVRKNMKKALKCTWKCLVLGLYNFALGYSTPMTVVTTFSPDFHQGQNWP